MILSTFTRSLELDARKAREEGDTTRIIREAEKLRKLFTDNEISRNELSHVLSVLNGTLHEPTRAA